MDRAIEVNEDRKDFPEHPYKKPIRRGGRGSRGKGRNKIIYQENGAPIIKRPRLDEPQHSSAFPKPPNRGVTVRPVPQLITPSIQEMNARIRHYKEAAEEWEKKFNEKTNATIEMYKQESEMHKARADLLAEQVKELEKKLEAKSAMQRQGIIQTFEMMGVSALREKIAEVFNSVAVSKTIESVFNPQPSNEINIKREVIE